MEEDFCLRYCGNPKEEYRAYNGGNIVICTHTNKPCGRVGVSECAYWLKKAQDNKTASTGAET